MKLQEGHLGILGNGWYISRNWIFTIDKILCSIFHPIDTLYMKKNGLVFCPPLGYYDKFFQLELKLLKKKFKKNWHFIWCKIY